jgi:hypothetical protein
MIKKVKEKSKNVGKKKGINQIILYGASIPQ